MLVLLLILGLIVVVRGMMTTIQTKLVSLNFIFFFNSCICRFVIFFIILHCSSSFLSLLLSLFTFIVSIWGVFLFFLYSFIVRISSTTLISIRHSTHMYQPNQFTLKSANKKVYIKINGSVVARAKNKLTVLIIIYGGAML